VSPEFLTVLNVLEIGSTALSTKQSDFCAARVCPSVYELKAIDASLWFKSQVHFSDTRRTSFNSPIFVLLFILQDNYVWVVGLVEEDVDRTTTLLKNFLKNSESVTLSYPCSPDVAEYVTKFSANDDQFPSSVTVNNARFGLQLIGPTNDAQAGL